MVCVFIRTQIPTHIHIHTHTIKSEWTPQCAGRGGTGRALLGRAHMFFVCTTLREGIGKKAKRTQFLALSLSSSDNHRILRDITLV